jgi:hypothetical protein
MAPGDVRRALAVARVDGVEESAMLAIDVRAAARRNARLCATASA